MFDIDKFTPRSGRIAKEDNTIINFANYLIDILYDDCIKTFDFIHLMIHKSKMWVSSYVVNTSNDAITQMTIKAGTKEIHLTIGISTGGDTLFKTYLNPTFTGGAEGTLNPAFNRKTQPDPAEVRQGVVRTAPTIATKANARGDRFIPGGSGGNAAGGQSASRFESVISPGDTLLIETQNKAGKAIYIEIVLDWYEEEV